MIRFIQLCRIRSGGTGDERLVPENGAGIPHRQQLHLFVAVLRPEEVGPCRDRPLVAVVVPGQDVRQPFRHQLPGPLAAGLRREQRGRVHLHSAAPRLRHCRTASTEQQLYRSGWARTGIRPSSHDLGERVGHGVVRHQAGELDQDVPGAPRRHVPGAGPPDGGIGRSSMTSAPRCSRGIAGAWARERFEGLVVARRGSGRSLGRRGGAGSDRHR